MSKVYDIYRMEKVYQAIGEYIDVDEVDGEEIFYGVFSGIGLVQWENLLPIMMIDDTLDLDKTIDPFISFIRESGFLTYIMLRKSYGII